MCCITIDAACTSKLMESKYNSPWHIPGKYNLWQKDPHYRDTLWPYYFLVKKITPGYYPIYGVQTAQYSSSYLCLDKLILTALASKNDFFMSYLEFFLHCPHRDHTHTQMIKVGFHLSMRNSWHVEALSELHIDREFCHFEIFVAIFTYPGYCISNQKGLKYEFPPSHPLPKTSGISAKPPNTMTFHHQVQKILNYLVQALIWE